MSSENLETEENVKNYETKLNGGLKIGVSTMGIGLLFIIVNLIMIKSIGKYFVKLTGAGFIMFYAGLGVVLAPGNQTFKVSFNETSKINTLFSNAGGLTQFIWVFYAIGGIAACIYTILCKYWTDVAALFVGTIAFTSLLFVIKNIYFFITNPEEKISDDYDSQVENEKTNPLRFMYCPSRFASVALILFFGFLAYAFGAWFYDLKVSEGPSYNVNRDTSMDHILVENLDKTVPVRFYQDEYKPGIFIYEDDILLWNKVTEGAEFKEEESDELNYVLIPLSEVIRHIAAQNSSENESVASSKISKLQVIGDDDKFAEYSYKNLNRIPEIKQFLQENPAQNSEKLILSANGKEFFDDFSKLCVVSFPYFTNEAFMVWDISSFIEFIGSRMSADGEPVTTTADVIALFESGLFDDSNMYLRDLDYFCGIALNQDYFKDNFVMINFGTSDGRYLYHTVFDMLYDKYKNPDKEQKVELVAE